MTTILSERELLEFEKKISFIFEKGEIGTPVHLSGGNEKQLIKIFKNIHQEDYVFSTHRSHYHALLKGIEKSKLEMMIREGKSMHIFDKSKKFFSSSIVAGCAPIAAGVALGIKKKNLPYRVWCFVGDGAEEEGHFYEAVRYVDGWDLPCTFIIEDNNRSVETPKSERYNKSKLKWPKCVLRYHYKPIYPHVGTGNFVKFQKEEKNENKKKDRKLEFILNSKKETNLITYGEALKKSMEELSREEGVIFIGYNIKYGTNAYGTLKDVPEEKKLETPLAENLMAGLATGLAIEGFKPVLFYERHDFILNALDCIVNHLDKLEKMSYGEFKAPVIIRATIGSKYPLDPGPQHVQDFTSAFLDMLSMPVYRPRNPNEIINLYRELKKFKNSALVIEEKDRYTCK